MYKAKKFISYMALCVLIFSLCACGEKGSENAAIYGETVGGLEDNELFAIIDTNASLPVLLVTSQVYNDGLGNQAALNCDVYYLIDKEVKNIGTIESMGTAYPIAYDETGIYAASGHDMQRFEIEKSGSLRLAEGIYEQFDESGNAAYTMKKGEETDVITEEEYYAAFEKYSNATIVNFSYGASDAGKAEVVTNSFDVVIVSNALHIVSQPEKSLREIKRVLKDDGVLIAPTFTHAENSLRGRIKAYFMRLAGFPLHSRWTSEEYLSFLRQNGWSVRKSAVLKASFPLTYAECVKSEV